MAISKFLMYLLALVLHAEPSSAGNLLGSNKNQKIAMQAGVAGFRREIRNAVKSGLGCGAPVDRNRFGETRAKLLPIWRALPLNDFGRMDRRSLRYLGHRYFMRRFGISIRGFEPALAVNNSHAGVADILSQQVANYVEVTLQTHLVAVHGFSLEDAVYMIVMLEQLIFDSDNALLEHIYEEQRRPRHGLLSLDGVADVLESYFIHWLVGEDIHAAASPLSKLHDTKYLHTAAANEFKQWVFLLEFVHGQIQTFEWARRQFELDRRITKNAWIGEYSFDDAREIIAGITSSFASFWDSECRATKETLEKLDPHGIGRVPLARYYRAQEHAFAASDTYLRELGALDESSAALGTQVLIANYMQSAANCIVSTAHYKVCCLNPCEAIVGEIETALASPEAPPSSILAVVSRLTVHQNSEEIDQPVLPPSIVTQLDQIAVGDDGLVRLQGRLFAQWLHYVFPRDCVFPHKIGSVKHLTPREYGDASVELVDVMQNQSSDPLDSFDLAGDSNVSKNGIEWMSQWSLDEELLTDTLPDLEAPFPTKWILVNLPLAGGVLFMLAGVRIGMHYKSTRVIHSAGTLRSHYV